MMTVLFAGFFLISRDAAGEEKTYKIGDKGPGGGIVFYDKGSASDGWRYLEAAPSDQSSGVRWSNGKVAETGATDTAVGRGVVNTRKILEVQKSGKYAAKLCADLKLKGFKDWFLPSKDELDLMYKNLRNNGFGNMANKIYWSSTESSGPHAWKQDFGKGGKALHKKHEKLTVRAIRAF